MQHVALNNVAIVWLELAHAGPTMLGYVALRCCYRLAGAEELWSYFQVFYCTVNILYYTLILFSDFFCPKLKSSEFFFASYVTRLS